MDDFERAQVDSRFSNEIVSIRDLLQPIVDGEINRAQCVAGERECCGGKRGKRKTTLKDARKIAALAILRINKAVNEFTDSLVR